MVACNRESMGVLNLMSTPRPLLSPVDALGISYKRRSLPAIRFENHDSGATISEYLDVPQTRQSKRLHDVYHGERPRTSSPHLIRTPWELERHKRNSNRSSLRRPATKSALSPHIFKNLPREVYDCVIEQLEQLHLAQDDHCPSCFLKDLYNLSLTSRAWDRATTPRMYRNITIVNDDHPRYPTLKIEGASRLKLLRRTLRERKVLARMVRELHLPAFQAIYQDATIEREEIVNLVASLVMACPELERLAGFHVPYTHSFDRLSYALSTRPSLKERLWYFADRELEIDDEEDDLTDGYYLAAYDPTEQFLGLNAKQAGLTTLALHQEAAQNEDQLTFRAIIGSLRRFPALQALSLSGLSSASFSNIALNALPPYLQSLRLENLPGINDKGLQRFASSCAATSLTNLKLINLEIGDIATISNFLCSRLANLERFTLAQHRVPTLPHGADVSVFEGPALTHIHWELRSQAGPPPMLLSPFSASSPIQSSFPFINDEPISCLATLVLAAGISEGHFPHLVNLRAPHDPQGTLQALCRPLATALLPSDATIFTSLPRLTRPAGPPLMHTSLYSKSELATPVSLKDFLSTAPPDSPKDSVMGSPMIACRMSFNDEGLTKRPVEMPLIAELTPTRSRLAAQSRILAARKERQMEFRVTDETGGVRVDRAINGYLGHLKSRITYGLRPDRERDVGSERGGLVDVDEEDEDEATNQWIVGVEDILGVLGGRERRFDKCRHLSGERRGLRAVELQALF